MTNIIVFDTETTGLPIRTQYGGFYKPSNIIKYSTCRLIELGYYIYSHDGNEIGHKNFIVKPSNFIINNHDIHGITHTYAFENGTNLETILFEFLADLRDANTIIGHNITFDINTVLSECYRHTNISPYINIINILNKINKICTISLAFKKLKLSHRIKLLDLYKLLFNTEWNQTHRAEDDARICALCYWHLQKL